MLRELRKQMGPGVGGGSESESPVCVWGGGRTEAGTPFCHSPGPLLGQASARLLGTLFPPAARPGPAEPGLGKESATSV